MAERAPKQTEANLTETEFPIEKSDIHWGKDEVTMKREKFTALIKHLQEVSQKLVEAEDELSFQQYDTQQAENAANVFVGLSASLSETEAGIQRWLENPKNSIQELSRRTGIPYATCHRIVTERLATAQVETGQLKKLARAIGEEPEPQSAPQSAAEKRTRGFFLPVLGANLAATLLPEDARIIDVKPTGNLLRRVKEEDPNVVLVDVSSSKLSGETMKALGDLAVKNGITMVFTGVRSRRNAAARALVNERVMAVRNLEDLARERG